ncbi:MAG: hypothetical protein VW498_07220 [Candidatus Thalassarchaeaceae archaeon]
MAYNVQRDITKTDDGYLSGSIKTVYTVIADSYLELITGIDEIEDSTLYWYGDGKLGVEGMPQKKDGKWHAQLYFLIKTDPKFCEECEDECVCGYEPATGFEWEPIE